MMSVMGMDIGNMGRGMMIDEGGMGCLCFVSLW